MYYVYSYLREDYSPYYIGKGSGNRAYTKGPKEVKPPKDRSRVKIIKESLTEEESFDVEKLYILVFGRIDLGTGILRNKTDGGDGSSGAIVSPEERKRRSERMKGITRPRWIYDKIAASNTGKKASAETRAKQSVARKGKTCTEEHKRNVSKAKASPQADKEEPTAKSNPDSAKSPKTITNPPHAISSCLHGYLTKRDARATNCPLDKK
jgi:hypothetical protein